MPGGDFEDGVGRGLHYEILEVHTYDGEVHSGGDIEDYLDETDRLFYEITDGNETFFRWVAGPFESFDDVETAISDEADFYSAA